MRLAAVLLCGFFAAGSAFGAETPGAAALAEVKSVYFLPMGHGFDQYLANRLARTGVFQVVTEPKRADAIVTDRLGPAFEQKMDEMFPPEQPAAGAAKQEAEDADPGSRFPGQSAAASHSSFSRAKGTLFMISPKTGAVLWSTFEQPTSANPQELNRTADRIAKRLEQDLKRKRKQ